jgi:hypothetical protein
MIATKRKISILRQFGRRRNRIHQSGGLADQLGERHHFSLTLALVSTKSTTFCSRATASNSDKRRSSW